MAIIPYVFPKLQTAKDLVRPLFKKWRFMTPFDSQLLMGPKHLRNLHDSTFIISFHHSEGN